MSFWRCNGVVRLCWCPCPKCKKDLLHTLTRTRGPCMRPQRCCLCSNWRGKQQRRQGNTALGQAPALSIAHPNGLFRPKADCIVCSDPSITLQGSLLLVLGLPHSSNKHSFASRSVANLSHVLARSDHIFLASRLVAVCASRTQSSACWRQSLESIGMKVFAA